VWYQRPSMLITETTSFGDVEIFNKIDYFWTFEYAVFYKITI
jgi:hypothetical protein